MLAVIAATGRDLPDDFPFGMFQTFLVTDVNGIKIDQVFLAMQQSVDLSDVRMLAAMPTIATKGCAAWVSMRIQERSLPVVG